MQLATPDPVALPGDAPADHGAPALPADLVAALSAADLDDLAERLYDRLRSDLRSELLADRDRVSDLADLWT